MIKTGVTAIFLMFCGVANATVIDSLEITGGSFDMSGAGGMLSPGAFASMSIGGYDGSSPVTAGADEASYADSSIATFTFGYFGPAGIYTAEADDVNSGFAPVSGDIAGGNLTLDLSSWTMAWGGYSLNQGSSSDMAAGSVCVTTSCTSAITTTYDEITGSFTASWDAVIIGGTFNSQLGSWCIEGVATASEVPIPAAVWLFGSGLVGLAAVARLRKVA